MSSGKVEDVSILADTLIGLYALEPLLAELALRKVRFSLFAPETVRRYIEANLQELVPYLRPLEALVKHYRSRLYFHRFLRQLLTSPEFSFQYRLLSDPRQFPGDWRYWVTAQLSRAFPKLPNDRVNTWLSKLVGPIVGNPFPTERILTVSRSSLPHMLCSNEAKIFTVLESWDHPVKWPVGHRSASVFVWNDDLANDWREYQGDEQVDATYPLKLRYWIERNIPVRPLSANRLAVYCAGTSSMSYINDLYGCEMKVIEAVCAATNDAGWQLLIKPKPNGKVGDFDEFAHRYAHVSIGKYSDASSPVDYFLDDAHNEQRQAEIADADLLINTLTTFALDAALMGVPCLQLDLRECPEYKGVAEGQTNHHLEKYLLGDSGDCLVVGAGELRQRLTDYLLQPDDRAERNRDRLRTWLTPKLPMQEAVSFMTDRILG